MQVAGVFEGCGDGGADGGQVDEPLAAPAITIAGSAVSVTGSFTPAPQPLAVSGTRTSLTIPAGSAALIVTR